MSRQETAAPHVRDYLALSIIATVFFCLPTGIVAIICSKQVIAKAAAGDAAGAQESSAKAKKWINISVLANLTFFLGLVALSMLEYP